MRRSDQLATAPDAVRDRRSRRHSARMGSRYRAVGRGRAEPAGPRLGRRDLCAQRARPVARQMRADRIARGAGENLFPRPGDRRRPAKRPDGFSEVGCEGGPRGRATRHSAAVQRGADGGLTLFPALCAGLSPTVLPAAPYCCARKPRPIELASADPRLPPRIQQNFLATGQDWATLRAGLRIVRDIGERAPLAPFAAAEIAPGPQCRSDAEIDAHIRANAITVHHPLGTCRMGRASDPATVVDPELKVLGVDGLRVVDASVMPDLVGGNINAVVIMIAEKAADLIRGRPALAPVNV